MSNMDFRPVNVALDLFCTLLSLLLMCYTLFQANRGERQSRFFVLICLCNIGMLLGDLPNWLCEGFARPWYPAALWLGCLLQFLGGTWIGLAYTGYLAAFLAPRVRVDRRYLRMIGLLGAVGTILVLLNLWNGMFYFIDGANVYHRGRWWWLSQLIAVLVMALTILIVLRSRRRMSGKNLATFLTYQLMPLPAILLQGRFYGLACTYPATTLAIVVIFLNIQSEQALVVEQQKREMTEANVALMLSQIQPHFLYNALSAVENLCATDPDLAQKAVSNFARYLRGNLRALTQKQPIPFEDELKHIRYYLNLEQMRFREKLRVVLETGPTDFLVPALSIQPLVENAVKHGVTCRRTGGTVTLRTQDSPDAWLILVEDDGVGFDPAGSAQDGRDHVGIGNIRFRLEAMAGGTLEIRSAPGRGTSAIVRIPKVRQQR